MKKLFARAVIVFVVLAATMVPAFAGDALFPKDVLGNAEQLLNTQITVSGHVANFTKSHIIPYTYQYTLTYNGSELDVYTKGNGFVGDGQVRTVSGMLKYDPNEKIYYLIESTGPPIWMLVVGGALVVVLVVVIVLILRTGKPERFCDECGGVLPTNGACSVCSNRPPSGPVIVVPPSGTDQETVGFTGGGGKNKPVTMLMDTAKATLLLKNGKNGSFNLGVGSKKIGRDSANDFVLDEETVSGEHAKIIEEDGTFCIQDLGSRNGTYVNDEKVVRQQLKDGDTIRLGKAEMKFVAISGK